MTEVVRVAVGGGVTVAVWVSDPERDVEREADTVPQVRVGEGPVNDEEALMVSRDCDWV